MAVVSELGNLLLDVNGNAISRMSKCKIAMLTDRGRVVRSSDEGSVMELERRGNIISRCLEIG